jgi:hypothetical protein
MCYIAQARDRILTANKEAGRKMMDTIARAFSDLASL